MDKNIYNKEWFKARVRYHGPVESITRWLIKEYGPFKSSLDLGAGDGWYSHILANAGTIAYAVDFHKWELPQMPTKTVKCITHDLCKPLDLKKKFDLVICIEVAEHLPESAANILCDTVARHTKGLLVFTAAGQGQGGDGHINCQPKWYWDGRLEDRGLVCLPKETAHVSKGWKAILGKRMWWLYTNVMIYRRES